jgi:hypothetical protein
MRDEMERSFKEGGLINNYERKKKDSLNIHLERQN